MRAIDTNIVVRLLTGDDPAQTQAATAVVENDETFIGMTVLLESEWVLRAGYGFAPPRIAAGLRALAGVPGVHVEQPEVVRQALDWLEDGLDFADALHLARSSGCRDFVTFDRKLARRAGIRGAIPVTVP